MNLVSSNEVGTGETSISESMDLLRLCEQHYLKMVSFPRWKKSKSCTESASRPLTAWSRCFRVSVALGRSWFQFLLILACITVLLECTITFNRLQSAAYVSGKHFYFSSGLLCERFSENNMPNQFSECGTSSLTLDDVEVFYQGCDLVPSSKKIIDSSLLLSFQDSIKFDRFRLLRGFENVVIQRSEAVDARREVVRLPSWAESVQHGVDFSLPWSWLVRHFAVRATLFAGWLISCLCGIAGLYDSGRGCLAASHVIAYLLLATRLAVSSPFSSTVDTSSDLKFPLYIGTAGAMSGLARDMMGPALHLVMAVSLWGDLLDPYLAMLSLEAVKDLLLLSPHMKASARTLDIASFSSWSGAQADLDGAFALPLALVPAGVGLILILLRLRLRLSLLQSLRMDMEVYGGCWEQILACPEQRSQLATLADQVSRLASILPRGPPRQRLCPDAEWPPGASRRRARQGNHRPPQDFPEPRHVDARRARDGTTRTLPIPPLAETSYTPATPTSPGCSCGYDCGCGCQCRLGPLLTNLDHLLDQAAGCDIFLRAKTRSLAAEYHGLLDAAIGPDDPPLYRPADGLGQVRWADVKAVGRCLDKCERAYRGDVSRLVDCCRQRLVFETVQALAGCLEGLGRDEEVRLVAVRSNMDAESAWFYGGFR